MENWRLFFKKSLDGNCLKFMGKNICSLIYVIKVFSEEKDIYILLIKDFQNLMI